MLVVGCFTIAYAIRSNHITSAHILASHHILTSHPHITNGKRETNILFSPHLSYTNERWRKHVYQYSRQSRSNSSSVSITKYTPGHEQVGGSFANRFAPGFKYMTTPMYTTYVHNSYPTSFYPRGFFLQERCQMNPFSLRVL